MRCGETGVPWDITISAYMLTVTVLECPDEGCMQHGGFLCPQAGRTKHLALSIAPLQEIKQNLIL